MQAAGSAMIQTFELFIFTDQGPPIPDLFMSHVGQNGSNWSTVDILLDLSDVQPELLDSFTEYPSRRYLCRRFSMAFLVQNKQPKPYTMNSYRFGPVSLICIALSALSVVQGYLNHYRYQRTNFRGKDIDNLLIQRREPFRASSSENNADDLPIHAVVTASSSILLTKRISKQRRFFRKQKEQDLLEVFNYDYNVLDIPGESGEKGNTTAIVLIHPIGVGIGRWFYNRLFTSFFDGMSQNQTLTPSENLLLITPDLIGSGSALGFSRQRKLPLLNISDWSDQLMGLMKRIEESKDYRVDQWCLVANGGCSPIALQVAARAMEGSASFQRPVSNVILSSVPRLPFFLQSTDPRKVAKSYKTLSGIVGNLFWWYSCRKQGKFIQKFSEKNLVANPDSLGGNWRVNCYENARRNNGKSKYSTFAFLAGTLQDGCASSLSVLKKHSDLIQIDIIKGRDVRQNRAKSWFWQKRKESKKTKAQKPRQSFRDYLEENKLGGREILIEGRISLAHEDAKGYRDALLSLLK